MDYKKEAGRQYIAFFKIWFILIGVLAVIALAVFFVRLQQKALERGNPTAVSERVFDEADVLSEEEELKLREYIHEVENKIGCDIVLLTTSRDMENGVLGSGYNLWYDHMRMTAQEFYVNNRFGYDKVKGDGVLLLDNWYEAQEGCMLITSGKAISKIGQAKEEALYDRIDAQVKSSPYLAYRSYVEYMRMVMEATVIPTSSGQFSMIVLVIASIAALIFILCNIKPKEGKVTVTDDTYVIRNSTNMRRSTDMYLRKHVTKRAVPKSGGSSGGGGSRGGGFGGGGGRRR